MNGVRAIKLLGLILGVVLLNIIVLSPGLLGVEIGGTSVFEIALGVTLLFVSLLVVLYGSYILLFKPSSIPAVKTLKSYEDYIAALTQYKNVKVLKKDIALALDQISRMEKKRSTLLDVLGQRFESTELSFKKFNAVSYEVAKLFYLNIRGILNKLSVFDASEFTLFSSQHRPSQFSDKLVQKKTALYNEYLAYVTGYLGANEEILLKLDKLLLEISLLDSTDYTDVEEMPCMKEIDELIKQTKFYKQ
ncbi:hypothetical protein BSK49_01405 [Paenibacillus odorifer]|uniref:5-bromo-4-chloroindolyl phosphate hydrolysis protein n=1 Tax=Paenibacillus odorifer TaxID=189426 RepID=A0ABX3H0U0_9BACL|nr:hypothetical protein [Paenibacillus odorifer]OMD39705.1 hypothetical protein BSO21_02330 [Paenibacillus odorifer]OMD93067.1 hypothetical protein BSK49_01405 [Paenibacillus odorifer]OMD95136.1 hypothetical protein BSK67_10480 [Paenibacillus odorifer]OME02716.1 hypothetical protein BSK54_10715 [Paenibacillus odorifer]